MNRVTKNIIYNFTGNIGSKVLSFLIVAITTRMFGSAIFGQFNIANAEYSYFSMFAILGMNGYGLYLLAKEPALQKRQEIVSDISSIKIVSGLIMAVILLVYAFLIPNSHSFVAPYALLLLLQVLDVSWAFQALQDMKLTAYGSLVMVVINACALAICYFAGIYSVYALIFANILSTVVMQSIYVGYLHKKHGLSIAFRRPDFFGYLKKAFPYMVSGLFAGINANIDVVIMGYLLDPREVGYYSVDYKLISEFIALCAVVFTPLFPVFIEKISAGSIAYMNKMAGFLRTALMSVIVPCTLVGVVYGDKLLGLLFGEEYSAGYGAFALLMVFISLLYYREIYGYILTAAGKQLIYLRIVAISAVLNIITNLIFIPKGGIIAAAATTVVSEIVNLLGMRFYVRKLVGVKPDNYNLLKLVLPLMAFFAELMLGRYLNIHYILVIAVACCTYTVMYFSIGVINIKTIKEWLRK